MTKRFVSLLLLVIMFSAHCAYSLDVVTLIYQYHEGKNALYRKYTVHESAAFYDRLFKFYDQFDRELKSVNFSELSVDGKADYFLLKNLLEKDRYFSKIDQQEFREVERVVQFAKPLYDFINARNKAQRVNAEETARMF